MHQSKTLIAALERSANSYPDHELVFRLSATNVQALPLSELALKSKRYADGLRRLGLHKDDLVGLLLSTRPEFILSLMGITRAGGVPVPLPSFSGIQSLSGFTKRLAHIVEHSKTRYILTEQKFLDLLRQSLGEEFLARYRVLTLDALETEGSHLPDMILHDDDLCLVQYTSGSTAAPKGVALTHGNVFAGLAAIMHGIQATSEDITCSWMPLFHDMGLIGLLSSISCGSSHYLHTQRSFIGNPGAWLREFSNCGATVYKGPNFSFAHMSNIDDEELTGLDLSRWRIAFNGSEPIDPSVVERFTERFSPYGFRPEAMLPVYGMAEATLAASFSPLGMPPAILWFDSEVLSGEGRAVKCSRWSRSAKGLVSVGRAVLDHTVRIVDDHEIDLPENVVGEIQIKGPAVMFGYYADPEATNEALHQGWLCTGDLGFISGGLLFITGRIKEMVIVNGRKFYPQDVEQLVRKLPGVYQDHCVAFGQVEGYTEQMSLAVETELSSEVEKSTLANRMMSLLADELGLSSVNVFLLKRGGIPRTSSGKYQRALLRDTLKGVERQELLSASVSGG
jgi:acyl-CoA synthetase (AMP-forming)/AMP-acid ligase II